MRLKQSSPEEHTLLFLKQHAVPLTTDQLSVRLISQDFRGTEYDTKPSLYQIY